MKTSPIGLASKPKGMPRLSEMCWCSKHRWDEGWVRKKCVEDIWEKAELMQSKGAERN